MESFVTLVIGFVLGRVPSLFDRRRRIRAHWKVLRAEIELCRTGALGIEQAGLGLTLSRLHTDFFDAVAKELVAEDAITPDDLLVLVNYFDSVKAANRSLDLAAASRDKGDKAGADQELKRTGLKLHHVHSTDGTDPYNNYTRAAAIAAKYCAKWWW